MRLLLISLLALAGAIAVTVAAIVAAPVVVDLIVAQVAHRAPGSTVVVSDPGESARVQRDMVLALLIPWLIVWVGALVHRLVHGAAPSAALAGFAFAVPTPVVAVAMALRTWFFLGLVEPTPPGGLSLMPSLAELCPGSWGIRFALVVTTLFVVVLGLIAKPDGNQPPNPRDPL